MTRQERLALKPGQLVQYEKCIYLVEEAASLSSGGYHYIHGPYLDRVNWPPAEINMDLGRPQRTWRMDAGIGDWTKAKRIA